MELKEVYIFIGPYGEYVEKVFGTRDKAREYILKDAKSSWKKMSKSSNPWSKDTIDKGFDAYLEYSLDFNKFTVEE